MLPTVQLRWKPHLLAMQLPRFHIHFCCSCILISLSPLTKGLKIGTFSLYMLTQSLCFILRHFWTTEKEKKPPRNIHAFKEDSLEITMMTKSNLGTRIHFVRKISLMWFSTSGTFVTHWQPYCWEAHRKISKCSLPIHLYHIYIQTQGSRFYLGLRTRNQTFLGMQKQYS